MQCDAPCGLAQLLSRRLSVSPTRPATKQPPHAFRGILQNALEPYVERFIEQTVRDLLPCHLELGVDLRFHLPLAEEVGREGMDRRDARDLELRECFVQPAPLVRG